MPTLHHEGSGSSSSPRHPGSSTRCVALLALSAAWLVGAGAANVHGSVIEYQFSGVITSSDPSSGVASGTPFSGTFSFDPSTNSLGLGFEGFGQMLYGGASSGVASPSSSNDAFHLQVGGQSVLNETGSLEISESYMRYAGQFGYLDPHGTPDPPHTSVIVGTDGPSTLSASLSLSNPSSWVPLQVDHPGDLNLGQLPDATLTLWKHAAGAGSMMFFQGTIQSLTAVPNNTPEPPLATFLLLASGAGFARSRRLASRPGATPVTA